MLYDLVRENYIHFKMQNTTHYDILKTVARIVRKTLVEHYFNNTNLVTKVKVETFHSQLKSQITKQLLTSISVDIRIYLHLEVIFRSLSKLPS